MPRLLYLLALCNLVVGTGAFVPSGMLGALAQGLGVSVGAAGQAMTAYALSTAVLAPLALVATGRWPRRRALLLAMALFAAGNAVCALAPNLGVLLAGRVLMGVGSMFTPIAAGIAFAQVEPARRGRALSFVFLGISMSYVVGLPLGSWLGLKFGWPWPMALIAVLSAACCAALAALPARIAAPGASFAGLSKLLARPPVAWTLALTLLYFTAIFLVFAYIGPVLQALYPMSRERLAATLMLFGIAGTVGTLAGGWAGDRWGARRTLAVQLTGLAGMMALVPLTRGHYAALVAVFVAWGVCGFGMMAPQQTRLAIAAPQQAPILLSLNTSMLYFGTAAGAAIGGAMSARVGFDRLAWVGLVFAVAGLATLLRGRNKLPPASRPASG